MTPPTSQQTTAPEQGMTPEQKKLLKDQRRGIPRRRSGEFKWVPFLYRTEPHENGLTANIEVMTDPVRGDFTLFPEAREDRVFKEFTGIKDVQSGDEAFDSRFYIHSDAKPFADRVFADPDNRRIVTELFDIGCYRLTYNGRKLHCQARLPLTDEVMNHDDILNLYVQRLASLAQALNHLRVTECGEITGFLKAARFATKTIPWVLFSIGMAMHCVAWFLYPLMNFEAAWILATACALPVWAVIVYPMLWKRKSLWHMRSMAIAALGWLLSLAAFPSGTMIVLNGALDRSDPVAREAVVVQIQDGDSSDSSDYVYVESWQKPGKTLRIRVPSVSGIVPHDTLMRANVRSGFLGFEWMTHPEFHSLK